MRFRWLVCWMFVATCAAQQRIKIRIVNNAVLVPVRIHGRDLNFLLDTGSEHSVIDAAIAPELGLTQAGEEQILKNYRKQTAHVATTDAFHIGTMAFRQKDMAVVPLEPVSRALGVAVHGVLGNDILQTFTFRLNFSRQELVAAPLSRLGNLGTPIKLQRSGNDFFLPLQIMSLPFDLLLDTGTNSTSLSWGTWQRLSQVWTPTSIVDGVVRAGFPVPPAFLVCLPNAQVGSFEINDQAVRIQRKVDSGAFSSGTFGGILGSEALHPFEITFDLEHDAIFLKPDPHFKPDLYRYTMVGLQFARNDEDTYSVMSVWKNSPADEAGISMGDRISAINGQSTSSMSTEQVSAQVHGEEGTPVNLIIERGGAVSAVTLHTRQMLCGQKDAPAQFQSKK